MDLASIAEASSAGKPLSGWKAARLLGRAVSQVETKFPRISLDESWWDPHETSEACKLLRDAIGLRQKYQGQSPHAIWKWETEADPFSTSNLPPASPQFRFECQNGVYIASEGDKPIAPVTSVAEYAKDYVRVTEICANGAVKTLTYKRLKTLQFKFQMHKLLNDTRENQATMHDPRDFDSVVKVDTHIHLSAAMTSKHLLDFIKEKVKHHGDDVVSTNADGSAVTLASVFQKLSLNVDAFTLNALDTRADNTFERFDHFNAKYNPFGKSELRDVFLKSDNKMNGRYYAEITQQLFNKLEKSKYIAGEYRISIYGNKRTEWDSLANWVLSNKLVSPMQRWLIQIPRIFFVFKKFGAVHSFQQVIDNIFGPLFEVTADPSSHPQLHAFLNQVSGFDSVDDESRPERKFDEILAQTLPADWTSIENPPYAYYSYYFYANITALNAFRRARGFKTFEFRPHAGESGDVDHLAATFLVAKHINHGINLAKSTPLQYLYYATQIGLAVSPLSNNSLFLDYRNNPFPKFFARGLNVSLSTDDPLQFHYTEQPLLEEYAIASQKWRLNNIDLSEIARNSVLQSGFEDAIKRKWLGSNYFREGVAGNDVTCSNIPNIRVCYRHETLQHELTFLENWALHASSQAQHSNPSSTFAELFITKPFNQSDFDIPEEHVKASEGLQKAIEIKKKYCVTGDASLNRKSGATDSSHVWVLSGGVYHVLEAVKINDKSFVATEEIYNVPGFEEFARDLGTLAGVVTDGPTATFSVTRLRMLEARFEFHTMLNGQKEKDEMKRLSTDYAHIYKVDNCVRLVSSMLAKQLLKFVRAKLNEHPEDIVAIDGSGDVTLRELIDRTGLKPEHLTLDTLDVKAEGTFMRLDTFNSKYNPFGNSELKTVFLEHSNDIKGRYFAELAKSVLRKRSRNPFQLYEYRLQLSGRTRQDWDELADWLVLHEIESSQVHWVVEISSSYSVFKKNGDVQKYQDMLDNIFLPLFEVTNDPSSHPNLHKVLSSIVSFDLLPGRVRTETSLHPFIRPQDWTSEIDPPYPYFLYFMWANIRSLNALRGAKLLNQLSTTSTALLDSRNHDKAAMFMIADTIHHGDIVLRSHPVLTYLAYLIQMGVVMSPLSTNQMAFSYEENPFGKYFKRGLRVTLATDSPLQLHLTNEPLSEEYAIAGQMLKLSDCDLSEIARTSVVISSIPEQTKVKLIGDYAVDGPHCVDGHKTNVPRIRAHYRYSTLEDERRFIQLAASALQNSSS